MTLPRFLMYNGNPVIRNGKLQRIPDGYEASDCDCCGCQFCTDQGGPYSSMSWEINVSGFPATYQYINTWLSCGGPVVYMGKAYRYTLAGLDAANGTYFHSSDNDNCIFGGSEDFLFTAVLDVVDSTGASDPNDICTWTNIFTTLNIPYSIFYSGFGIAVGPSDGILNWCKPYFGSLNSFPACTGGSGSAFVSGFPCHGDFTYNVTVTPTGVP